MHRAASPPSGAAAPLIEADGLVKRFGPFTAVDNVGFSVARGEVLGFLGPNGAGKSTTMKMLTGFLAPDGGVARICGIDAAARPVAAARLFGYLPEGAPAYADMTPRGFLRFVARTRGVSGVAAIDTAVARAAIGTVLDQPIETLSKGYKRRVGLAQAILHDPDVLILDEPTDGLDPNQKHEVRELIREMAPTKAILVSTHILEEVEAVCTRAIVIDRGRIVADGSPEALMARSPRHNAVTLTLPAKDAAAARAGLEAMAKVAAVEVKVEAGDGAARLTLFPRAGGAIAADVAALAAARGWALSGLSVERGRLDDVFRDLTRGDAAAPAPKAAA